MREEQEMETNYYGTLNMVRAFAPALGDNEGGATLNVLSVLSWFSFDGSNTYAAAKAAEWSLTNGVRLELADQGTLVTGLVLASTDTDMMAGIDVEKNDPVDVVRAALDGSEAEKARGGRRRSERASQSRYGRRPEHALSAGSFQF